MGNGVAILNPDGSRQTFETGAQRRGDEGAACCPTPCGPPCDHCATPPPSLSLAFDLSNVLPEYVRTVFSVGGPRTFHWFGDPISTTVCLSPYGPCTYFYAGGPALAEICSEVTGATLEEMVFVTCDDICFCVVATFLPGRISVSAYLSSGGILSRLFAGEAEWDCGATPVEINNTLVRAPNPDVIGHAPFYENAALAGGGTCIVSRGEGFCETPAACAGASIPEVPTCDPGCECADFYKGKFNFDGSLVPFCLEIVIAAGLPGQSTSCAWSQIHEDFTARMGCDVLDGVPTRVLDVSHATYGTHRFTQPMGDGCPDTSWTAAYVDPGVTVASVEDFVDAEDCSTCPDDVSSCADKVIFEFSIDTATYRKCLTKSGLTWALTDDDFTLVLQCIDGEWSVTAGGVTFTAPVDGDCPPEEGWTSDTMGASVVSVAFQAGCNVPCDAECPDCDEETFRIQLTSTPPDVLDTVPDGEITDPNQIIQATPEPPCVWLGGGFKPEDTGDPGYVPLFYNVSIYCLDGWWWCEVFVGNDLDSTEINTFVYRAPHTAFCPGGLEWELYSQTNGEGGTPALSLEVYP